ncbi:MAG TPA: hypothetical protein VGD91_19540 [Trebonia sp.]
MTTSLLLEPEAEPDEAAELPLPVLPAAGVELVALDEQAARPAARRPAAVSATALLLLNLLIVNFDLSHLRI